MLKQSLIYLFVSILIVVLAPYVHLLMVYIITFYTYAMIKITPIFSVIKYGSLIRNVIALVLIPVIIAGIPALLYRAIKRHNMPYFIEITWILWLIIVLGKVLIQ